MATREDFKTVGVKLNTTANSEVYISPNASANERAIVKSILVANTGLADVDITVSITQSNNTEIVKLVNNVTVPLGASLEIVSQFLVLQEGRKIFAAASAANNVDITVSALEIIDVV